MIQLLVANPLLLLFVVAAIGYPIGHLRLGGGSLGVAAVLFVGLAVGALHPDLKLPELVYQLGLVIFVYTVGLSSGRTFFVSLRRQGLRDNLLVVAMLTFAAALSAGLGSVLDLSAPSTAGMFTGSTTNTAALAGVLDAVKSYASADLREQLLTQPVVSFSITYPMGVIGVILAMMLVRRLWHVAGSHSTVDGAGADRAQEPLQNRTISVTCAPVVGRTIADLMVEHRWALVFGRIERVGHMAVVTGDTRLALGDRLSAVGPATALAMATAALGVASEERLDLDRDEFDYRRVFVSNPVLAGRQLRDLDLPRRYGAFVTRVRRGDTEMLARGSTVLELGDRVRVVARRTEMETVSRFFGDSYRALSEVDILTFNLGLGLGLLVGMIPLPLPGGIVIRLGFAGGPLLVALCLGALGRTGPLVWNMPYSANLTLRQFGLILFLAGVGTRSGYAFLTTLREGSGGLIFGAGVLITMTTTLLSLWIGYRLLKIPWGRLMGMVAGIQTQPAVLGYALEQTGDDEPNLGYAAVYPVALIAKIVLAQILLALLR